MEPALVEEAEKLFALFRVVEHQVASLLVEGRAEGGSRSLGPAGPSP